LEFPGKAAAIGLCDTIEGPIVELTDGTVTAVHDVATAEALLPDVQRIIDLGALLVPFGEFLENNRALSPGAYTLDWHLEELRAKGVPLDPTTTAPSWAVALGQSRLHGVPIHPRFLLFWHDLSSEEIGELSRWVEREGSVDGDHLVLPWESTRRELLVRLGFLHRAGSAGEIRASAEDSAGLLAGLGLGSSGDRILREVVLEPVETDPLTLVSRLTGAEVKARAPSRVGARVGRPEKARQRKMSPNVHVLFPIGDAGGAQRSIAEAARRTLSKGVPVQLGHRVCPRCQKGTVWLRCACGTHTEPT
ncbi:MAG: DNA polymerase II large subunit, partial [Thermoplasmata archaeon]|nr:DNA polymerase II large subunit [Thermoplasmata archaeon]